MWDAAQERAAKVLFGRPLRVLLADWVLSQEGRPFFQMQAQDAMRHFNEAASGVKSELDKFVGLDMLSRFEDERRVWFTALTSPYWRVFEEAAVAFGLREHGGSHRSTPKTRSS